MEIPSDKTLNQTVVENQRPAETIVPTGQNFIPVTEMFETPETLLADALATDPDSVARIDRYKADIDKYGINAMASLGVASPSFATDTYDPVKQQQPAENNFSKLKNAFTLKDTTGDERVAPRFAGMRQSQFMRYYEHPDFSDLGFTPYANMEEYYNANSTVYDDYTRMWGQYLSLAGSGFSSVYRSIGDLFDGDSYWSAPDLDSATEFEDAMATGNSSRGGFMGWTNNFLLNSAYTVGILSSIAVEELALAAGTVFTGGGAGPAAAVRTTYNIGRAGTAFKNFFNITRFAGTTRDIYNTLKTAEYAKDFYSAVKTGGKVAGQMFLPNTMYALRNLKSAKNATQNGINLAKMSTTFGGFYRDLRMVNYAMAESKMEAGMSYNTVMRTGVDIYNKNDVGPDGKLINNFDAVTPEEMAVIQSKAAKAGFYTQMANAPIIYASNWFVLGNALGGFNKSLGRMMNESFTKGFGRILKTKATKKAGGGLAKDVFEKATLGGYFKAAKAAGFAGGSKLLAGAALRYFSQNVAEGIQEVSQEAVSAATTGYFTAVLEDPLAGGIDLRNQMIISGMGDQLSAEGFSVFMSGFLMGGAIQGPQKLFFQGVPAIYEYGKGTFGTESMKEKYQEYKNNREKTVDTLIESWNTAWNNQVDNPSSLFDPNKFNFLMQKQVADAMKANAYDQDMFGFIDEKDFSKFQQMYTLFQTGGVSHFRSQLKDFLNLTDAELAEAFPGDAKDIKNGKLRERFTSYINYIDKVQDNFEKINDKFQNPYDVSNFKEGEPGFVEEALKQRAYEHAKYLVLFTQDSFERALERSMSIYEKLAQEPLFDKMAAKDIVVLSSIDNIDQEIKLLTNEIITTVSAEGPNAKGINESNKRKQEKIKRLSAIKAILTDPKNTTKKGLFDRRKIGKLRSEFRNYVRYLAEQEGSFIERDRVDNALKDLVDYYALKDRAQVYDKAIEYLSNPERFNEIVERSLQVNRELYKNIKKNFEKSIKKYISIQEANELMNQLAAIGVYPDPAQTKKFLQTGDIDVLKDFYSENGLVSKLQDVVRYDRIQRMLETYRGITQTADEEKEEETKTEEEVAEETRTDQQAILDDAGIDVVLDNPNDTPMLNDLLARQYRKYQATAARLGEKILLFEEWRNSQQGLSFQNTFNALKKVWASGVIPFADAAGNPYTVKISREDLNSEKGFKEWFTKREVVESAIVKRILDQAGLEITDIVEESFQFPEEGATIKGSTNRVVYKRGALANIVKITTKDQETGQDVVIYKLVDDNNKPLSPKLLDLIGSKFGAYTQANEAVAALKKIEATAPDSSEFIFDDMTLHQGQLLFDAEGKRYIVLSTPKQVQGGYLRIIEEEKNTPNIKEREKFVIKLQQGQVKNKYSVQDLQFSLLPNTVSRLNINEPVTPYPYKNAGESREMAYARYNLIMSLLTAEELTQLGLVVSLDPQGGTVGSYYTIQGADGTTYSEANPFLKTKRSKYTIGISIANEDVKARIDAALLQAGFQPLQSGNGVFAFIGNENFLMTDKQGNEVDPRTMSREQALNTIFVPESISKNLTKEETLKLAQDNFALNAAIVSALDGMNITEETKMFLSELPFRITFTTGGSIMAYPPSGKQEQRSLSDLMFQHADQDGNYLIYDLKRTGDGKPRTVQSKTNLEGSAATKLRKKVKSDLIEQGLWDQMINGTDRYVAAVRLPNGKYGIVNLKPASFTQTEVQDLYTEIIERAQLTQKENLDKKKEAKDKGYNTEYNQDLENRLYIATKPGYRVSLQVTPWGKVQLQLFDTNTRKQVGETITIDQKIVNDTSSSTSSVQKIQTLIDQFNNNTDIKTSGVKLTVNNLRRSFPDNVDVNTLIESTTTAVLPQVVEKQTLRIVGDSSFIQASKNVDSSAKNPKVEPVEVESNPEYIIAEEAEESILDLSDAEFQERAAEDFANLEQDFIQHIVNKLLRTDGKGGVPALTAREEAIYNALQSKINMLVARAGGMGSVGNINFVASETGVVENTPLAKAKLQLQELQEELLKDVDGRSKRKVLRENKKYQKLLKKVRDLEKKEANKIIPASELSQYQVENINDFITWASQNLPDFINIADIGTLGNNLKAGGIRVGSFVLMLKETAGGLKIDGTLYTGATSPFKYHEAFHGVFRLLFTDAEIKKYRAIAAKEVRAKLRAEGKNFKEELERFRNSADTYANMTETELKNEYYEEYLADEFEKFKMSPKKTKTDPEVKNLFTRILEWIKSIFKSKSLSELQTLFADIDAGKYKGAKLARNEFTESLVPGVAIEANALVPYASEQKVTDGRTRTGFLYLDNDIADPMIRSIAAMYLNRTDLIAEAYNPATVLQELMDDFAWLYSPGNPINENKSITQLERLAQIESAFDFYSEEITKQVVDLLNIISDQATEQEFTLEEMEDFVGLRTTSQYDLDASLIGGFRSLSSKIRAYIATTTLEETDYFGNIELTEGEPLITAVDFVDAYNGLLKSVKSMSDPKSILQSMYFFGQDNVQAGAVVNRILQDVGISQEELLSNASLGDVQRPLLLQSILKGFENFRVDYIFNERDEAGNIRIYSASQRDDINAQLDRWYQAWNSKSKLLNLDKKRREATVELIQEIESLLGVSKKSYSNVQLSDMSRQYSQRLFDMTGIKLSPLFLQFSIIQNRPVKTKKQQALKDLYKDQSPLSEDQMNQMGLIIDKGADIFDTGEEGMDSRLNTMSQNNAAFDETIGASVFKNPNGDLVYAHQLPTYHLKAIEALNNSSEIEALKTIDPYMARNLLLNSAAFMKLSAENRLRVLRIAGSKVGQRLASEQDINEQMSGLKSTQTYGDFTPQEFALAIINNYTALLNTRSNKVESVEGVDQNGNKIPRQALAPVLIRVMEASNTGDLINLPVIKTVEYVNGKSVLTDEAVMMYIERIATEFERINRESINTDELAGDNILGYNTPDGRAFKFVNNAILLPEKTRTLLEEAAVSQGKQGKTITLNEALKESGISVAQLKKQVRLNLEIQFDQFQTLLDDLNVKDQISRNITEGPVNAAGVQRKELVDSARLLNLNFDETHNLKQIFFNDWLNTGAINEILLGDQAVSLSSPVDRVKRAKMQNAAYYSAYSAVSAPEYGVHHPVENISLITLQEPIGESSITGENIDEADAQMYITTKAFRYMWFGFGKLSPAQAELITKIEEGQQVTSDEIFGTIENPQGLAKMQALMNSKKFVYGDGSTFLKMSAFTLTPEFTSLWDQATNSWVAKPNRVRLHNLRVKLEALEQDGETLGIAAPLSAIKMKKQLDIQLDELDNANPFTRNATLLDARYMGLQVLNPSNKLEILDPTQIKQIVTSEQNDDVFVEALDMNVGKIREKYNEAVSQRVLISYKNRRNLIFTLDSALDELQVSKKKGAITPNLSAFLNYAVQSLKAAQANQQTLDFFSTTEGIQNYNLNNPLTIQKFEQLFLSYFSKGVLSERSPGIGLTLLSDFGNKVYRRVYEVENGIPVRSEVIRENVWLQDGSMDQLEDLEFLTNNNIPEEGVVVLDVLRHGLMEYTNPKDPSTATGQRYTEMIMPSHFKSVMDLIENDPRAELPEVISKMFGVRIPSQDNHSAVNMKLVDFMPAYYGSTAMFAKELVEIAGSDFDIDKVYTLIKDFYVEDGLFKEYKNEYNDYLRYVTDKVGVSGTIYSEALGLYLNGDLASNISNTLTDAEQDIVTDAGLSESGLKALQILGLPITRKQYDDYVRKHGAPFAAPLNNKILDYRYALVGNTGVTEAKEGVPISYQAANTEALTITLATLAEQSDVFKQRIAEDNVDVDNMLGKIKAFKANKGASIGAVVLPNLYLSLLTEYKIKVDAKKAINVNGNTYNDYSVTVLEDGRRKQDVLSALITMATDNAKDRLVSKLGLNRHAVGLVTNMIALGVPLKTSLLLINNPIIQEDYTQALNKKSKIDPGINRLIDSRLQGLKQSGSKKVKITDDILLDAINNPEDVSNDEMFSILSLFRSASTIKDFTQKMGAPTSLSKGLSSSIAGVKDTYNSTVALFAKNAPMNLSPIYKGKTWQNTYLRIFTQINNDLLPATFLTGSEGFAEILAPVLESMNTESIDFTEEIKAKVGLDLLSYLTIKAYQHQGIQSDPQSVASLSNDILYPQNGGKSIVSIIEELRTTEAGQDNFFLDNFVLTQKADSAGNNTGLSLAEANTFRQLNSSQKLELMNDYARLYGSIETRNGAQTILNYIMVKDGMQMGYASLVEAISPFMMTPYLDKIDSVSRALKEEATYESVFGISKEELKKEFKEGYLESNVNGSKLVTYESSPFQSLPRNAAITVSYSTEQNELNIRLSNPELKKDYVRLAIDSGLGSVIYRTFKLNPDKSTDVVNFVYDEIQTRGSNQQSAVGFMFGDRPTYSEVRKFVAGLSGLTPDLSALENLAMGVGIDEAKQIQTSVLKNESSIIEANENEVNVKMDVEGNSVNISDIAGLLDQDIADQQALEEGELEGNVIEDNDQAQPEMSPEEKQLSLDLDFQLEDSYDIINEEYYAMMKDRNNKIILMQNNLFPLSNMIEAYENRLSKDMNKTSEENQKEFIEDIKNCLLK